MKRNYLLIIAIVIILVVSLVIFLIVNSSKDTTPSASNNMEAKATLTIEDFKNAIVNNGLEIANETSKAAELIGAKEGYSFNVNGKNIEAYIFDLDSNNETTKNNLKSAKESGIITMPSFNNYELECIINKNLVLIASNNETIDDDIKEILNKL